MLRNILIGLAILVLASAALLILRPGAGEICTTNEVLQAPSGHDLRLCQTLYETQPSDDVWAVVRIVDPELSGTRAEQTDHDWACDTWGLSALANDPRPTRIIVQIMAAPFTRGEPTPGITQSIEAYSIEDATCMWELL